MKKCSKCQKSKDTALFCKDSRSKDGLQSQCKACKSKSICDYHKTSKGKEYRRKNRRKWDKTYADKNPDKAKKKSLDNYYRNRVARNVSRQIRRSLSGNKNGCKWEKLVGYTIEELKQHLESLFDEGMTWENYGEWHIDHIKPLSSFNIRSHQDKEFKECWSLKNLQPLWAKDNLKKGNLYEQ